jgi:hypothetical protein
MKSLKWTNKEHVAIFESAYALGAKDHGATDQQVGFRLQALKGTAVVDYKFEGKTPAIPETPPLDALFEEEASEK